MSYYLSININTFCYREALIMSATPSEFGDSNQVFGRSLQRANPRIVSGLQLMRFKD